MHTGRATTTQLQAPVLRRWLEIKCESEHHAVGTIQMKNILANTKCMRSRYILRTERGSATQSRCAPTRHSRKLCFSLQWKWTTYRNPQRACSTYARQPPERSSETQSLSLLAIGVDKQCNNSRSESLSAKDVCFFFIGVSFTSRP